ncbi:MAG: hypothetical protein IPO24_20110 [Bacteroidetes bacterium]|nr:hypothetical protein [Bacteroidota bacterium]
MSADDKELALVECDDYYDYNKGFAAVKVDSFWAFMIVTESNSFINSR